MYIATVKLPKDVNVNRGDICITEEMLELDGKDIIVAEEKDYHLWAELMDNIDTDKYDLASPLEGGEDYFSWKSDWVVKKVDIPSHKFYCTAKGNCVLVGSGSFDRIAS